MSYCINPYENKTYMVLALMFELNMNRPACTLFALYTNMHWLTAIQLGERHTRCNN